MKLYACIAVTCFIFGVGCATQRSLGDIEFEAGNYRRALDHYEQEFAEGKKDSETYAQAARASIQLGSFGSAERYYGKSLSNGGDVVIARELVKFYVRTSNYGSAIRVYHYLLNVEKDKQPVYNNLGAAYLYSGSPFDAESYLLIAQQLRPSDPFPYLNLGLLYDQHLKRPKKAAGFYQCFLKLAPEHNSSTKVSQRLAELEKKFLAMKIDCEIPFSEPGRDVSFSELREEIESIEKAEEKIPEIIGIEKKAQKIEIIQSPIMLATSLEKPPTIFKEAAAYYEARKFESANKAFESIPMKEFNANLSLAYGDTLVHLHRYSEALIWLRISEGKHAKPITVELLIFSALNLDDFSLVSHRCKKYKNRPAYQNATRRCPIQKEDTAKKTEKVVEEKQEKREKKETIRFLTSPDAPK